MNIFDSPPIQKVIDLLSNEGLPIQDLSAQGETQFFSCGDQDSPDGVIGLEIHGRHGLLRSLVVSNTAQNQGCGRVLVDRVETAARDARLEDIYLLTTTAENYFGKLGYELCCREDVAEPIKNSAEFSSLCPDTATVMKKSMKR